jgi:hypothetical protein
MHRLLKSAMIFILVLLLSVSLIGCGENEEASKETMSSEKTSGVNEKKADSNDTAAVPESASPSSDGKESKQTETPVTQESKSEGSNTSSSNTTNSASAKPAAETKPTTPTTSGASAATPTKGTTSTTPAASTPPKTQDSAPVITEKPAAAVTISIKGPKDRGTILASSKVEFKDGATVFDILLQIAKKQGIQVESRGSGATAYIEGIDNIYEFDYGVKSGWVFELNGISLTKSIGTMKVKDGDTIECYYTE